MSGSYCVYEAVSFSLLLFSAFSPTLLMTGYLRINSREATGTNPLSRLFSFSL